MTVVGVAAEIRIGHQSNESVTFCHLLSVKEFRR